MIKTIFIYFDRKLDIVDILRFLSHAPGLEKYHEVSLTEKHCIFCKIQDEKYSSFSEYIKNSKYDPYVSIDQAKMIK